MPEHEKERKSSQDIIFESGREDFDGIHELSVVAEGEERVTWFVWALVASSAISGLLFGQSTPPFILAAFNCVFQAMILALYPAPWSLLAMTWALPSCPMVKRCVYIHL